MSFVGYTWVSIYIYIVARLQSGGRRLNGCWRHNSEACPHNIKTIIQLKVYYICTCRIQQKPYGKRSIVALYPSGYLYILAACEALCDANATLCQNGAIAAKLNQIYVRCVNVWMCGCRVGPSFVCAQRCVSKFVWRSKLISRHTTYRFILYFKNIRWLFFFLW